MRARLPRRLAALVIAAGATLAVIVSPSAHADVGPVLAFSETDASATCAGTVVAHDTWTSTGNLSYTVDIDGDPASTQTHLASAATSGEDTWTFHGVPAGPHVVRFLSPSNAVQQPLTVCATSLSMADSAAAIDYGQHVSVSTQFLERETNSVVAGELVSLYAGAPHATSLALVASAHTDVNGIALLSVQPGTNTVYQWRYAGSAAHAAATSATRTVLVRQAVSLHTTASSAGITPGTTVVFWGGVSPNERGQTVYLQYLTTTGWHNVAQGVLEPHHMPNGTYVVGYIIKVAPYWSPLRTYRPRTSVNQAGYSAAVNIAFAVR